MCVIAKESTGVVRVAADHSDLPDPFAKGQDAVISEQHDALFRRTAGEPFAVFLLEDRCCFSVRQGKRILEKSHPELGFQDPQHRLIQAAGQALVVQQRSGKTGRVRKLHIHPGHQRAPACVRQGLRRVLGGVNVADRTVIGYHNTVEAHFIPQKARQDFMGCGDGLSVPGTIAGHNALQASQCEGGLEGFSVDFPQDSRRHVGVSPMNAAFHVVRSQKMLGSAVGAGGQLVCCLNASGISAAEG